MLYRKNVYVYMCRLYVYIYNYKLNILVHILKASSQ